MAVLKHIGWAYGVADIGLVRSAFDAAGLPIFIHGDEVHQMMGQHAVAMGGARVMVFDHDIVAACALLDTCRLTHTTRFRWRFAVFLLALSVFFGPVSVPFRAIYLRDAAAMRGD
ncbi:hypothetical protein [Aliiroseovarius sediminis]|uniref:hypothetical protein n=1 Tax=Aliiroseovarius sediminis TaxID=2925839 RepID=UPI001F57465F|nr:hypothetical protein [Aliiroseovarius sediminis]MCI2393555.1 hypothetical protein [Aliiroseovarius sediminis]